MSLIRNSIDVPKKSKGKKPLASSAVAGRNKMSTSVVDRTCVVCLEDGIETRALQACRHGKLTQESFPLS